MLKPQLPFNRGIPTLQEKAFRQPPRQNDHLKGRLRGQEGARRLGGIDKKTKLNKKTTKWEIKYKFWQQRRYCKSLVDALKLNTIIRPPLTGTRWRAGDGKTNRDPCSAVAAVLGPLLQPTTCSFVYSPDSSKME